MSDTNKTNKKDIEKLKEAKVETWRAKQLMVNPSEFVMLFTKGMEFKKHTKLIEGVPEDAQLGGIAYDVRRDAIIMIVLSDEYEAVPRTEFPPVQLVSFQMGVIGGSKKKNTPKRKKK